MSACRNGKTPGRMRPFPCTHRGFGVACHRCEQGNELAARAGEIMSLVQNKAKTFPAYIRLANQNNELVHTDTDKDRVQRVEVRGGGQKQTVNLQGKMTVLDALSQAALKMRDEATRLLKPRT